MTNAVADKSLIRTADLKHDWFANVWSDGTVTLRNGVIGMRIELPKASVNTLKAILASA